MHDESNLGGTLAYLVTNFFLSMAYFAFLAGGYMLGGALSMFLIGLPILAFMMSATRSIASFNWRLGALLLGVPVPDAVNPTLEQSVLYLFSRLPLGFFSLLLLSIGLPFVLLETVLLTIFGVRERVLARVLRALTMAMHDFSGGLMGIRADPAARERAALERERAALMREREALMREHERVERARLAREQRTYDGDTMVEMQFDDDEDAPKRKRGM